MSNAPMQTPERCLAPANVAPPTRLELYGRAAPVWLVCEYLPVHLDKIY